MTADPGEAIAAQLVDTAAPDRIERAARWTVEDVFAQMVRARTPAPDHYSDAAVRARAERDVTADLLHDVALGFTHSQAQVASYRTRYTTAFLAAWRDAALWKACAERYKPTGYVIVCMR